MRFLTFALFAVTTGLGFAEGTNAPATQPTPRIAIIGSADFADLAALITTELSEDPSINLLERDDLAKVGDELKLQTFAGSDPLALGKLLGADGLLFLDKNGDNLEVRFTAVGLGFVLFDLQIPLDEIPDVLAKSLSERIALFVPKLRLDPGKATPLSLLNLRSEIASAQSDKLERQLTLLLESRLASVPEFVVLERRHADPLGFEHSIMSPMPPDLLKGAYLIDGSFRPVASHASEDLDLSLRIRSPKTGKETTIDLQGSEKDLPGLVSAIADKIGHETGSSSSPSQGQTQAEAREYLQEGIWAWRRNLDATALEALDSAELLGETASDLYGLRVNVLCELDSPKDYLGAERDPAKLPPFERRLELVRRAEQDMLVYRDHGEEKLQIFVLRVDQPVRLGVVNGRFLKHADDLLTDLEASPLTKETDSLRQDLRAYTGFDPLHNDASPYVLNPDDLSESLDEEMTYFRLQLTVHHAILYLAPEVFCPRFLKNPADRQAAYDQLLQEVLADPQGRLAALTLYCLHGDAATREADYPLFLQELWNQREELFKSVLIRQYLSAGSNMSLDVRKKYIKQALPLLHYWMTRPERAGGDICDFLWKPEWFSPEDVDSIWTDLQAQKALLAKGTNEEGLLSLEGFEKRFLTTYPSKLSPDSDAALPRLTVDRYWNGKDPLSQVAALPNESSGRLFTDRFYQSPDGDGVWVLGRWIWGEKGWAGLYQIHLPDMTIKFFPIDCGEYPVDVVKTSKAIYVSYNVFGHQLAPPVPDEVYLKRYDLTAQTWSAPRRVTDFTEGSLYVVDDHLYVNLITRVDDMRKGEGGLARYDWDADKLTILASSRRKPAQNQFDDRTEYTIQPFVGPGNKLCISVGSAIGYSINYVQDQPSPWPAVFDLPNQFGTHETGRQTLAASRGGEVVLLDPDKPDPIPLMTPTVPTDWRALPGNAKAVKVLPPWAAQAEWKKPPEVSADNVGYHDGHLYLLVNPNDLRKYFELLVFNPGQADPVRIPLHFLVNGSDDEAAKALGPSPGTWGPYLSTVDQGICLHDAYGFWFLPYGDIDAYLKTAPNQTPTKATAQKT